MNTTVSGEVRYKVIFGHNVGDKCTQEVSRVIGATSETEIERLDIRAQGDIDLDECSLCRMPFTRIVRFELAHKPKI